MSNTSQSQSIQTLDDLRQQFSSTSDRESVYWRLMEKGEPGYRVICDLFANGKLSMHDWIDWEYNYNTRSDFPDAGNSMDNFMYSTTAKDKVFLSKMAKAFAKSEFPDQTFIEMMQNERKGARLLGYSVIRIRYIDVPKFAPDSSKAERVDQLAAISKFLAAKLTKP